MTGVEMNSLDETFDLGGVQEVGTVACETYLQKNMSMRGNDCHNANVSGGYGLEVLGGSQLNSISSYPLIGVLVNGAGSALQSVSSTFQAGSGVVAIQCNTGTVFNSMWDTIGTITIDSGCIHQTQGSSYAGAFINNGSTNTFGGGNKFTVIPTGTGSFIGNNMLTGSCQGTATSSATLGLYGLGQFANPACTSTVVNLGVPVFQVPLSGSINGLRCTATHAGVSASSGVVTVLKNNSTTVTSGPITCTIGTGTSCTDVAHYDIPAVGDVYSIKFTTQGSEVLAGVQCTLFNW